MEQVKLCRDCRFYQPDKNAPSCGLCRHPLSVNPGAGVASEFCRVLREFPAISYTQFKCGREGNFWEPHPSKPPHCKLCRDCQFYRRDWAGAEYAKCGHPRLMNQGVNKPEVYCEIERDHPCDGDVYPCGREGKLWKQRRSLWQRLKERLTHA